MDRPEFTSLRLYAHRRGTLGNNYYIAINRMKAFESADGTGTDVLTGGTASASSTYSAAYPPSAAFTDAGYWSSAAAPGAIPRIVPEWLRYDLPAPKKIGSVYILASQNAGYIPEDMELQGSNDGGVTWSPLLRVNPVDNAAVFAGQTLAMVSKGVSGRALTSSGAPANFVLILDWAAGTVITRVAPDENGDWFCPVQGDEVAVVTFGPAGSRPEADGPVVAENYTS